MLAINCHAEKTRRKESLLKVLGTKDEIKVVLNHFQRCVAESRLPGKIECFSLIKATPCLKERKWTTVKYYVRNHLGKSKKSREKERTEFM